MPLSCNYLTLFNYGGKKAKDVILTSGCFLASIMPDSVFDESMKLGIKFILFYFNHFFGFFALFAWLLVLFFYGVVLLFLGMKDRESAFSACGKILICIKRAKANRTD